jgi:NAD(P)-dependent dehydrogenase (short-subunit alcohol dehydrogenase family)
LAFNLRGLIPLAVEAGEYHIQVNCIFPGSIDTHNGDLQTLPGRAGRPEEVAELALFLSSSPISFK